MNGPTASLSASLKYLDLGALSDARGGVVWLHGLGASADEFAPLVPYLDAHHLRFIFPEAPLRPVTINFGAVMPAWYDIRTLRRDPDREDEEHIREVAEQLRDLLTAVEGQGIPSHRIVLAGFSQGAAMALHVGLRYPRPLAGLLILSGYLVVAGRLEDEAHHANAATAIQFCHGSRDGVVPMAQGRASYERLQASGRDLRWLVYPMGHEVCDEEVGDIRTWLAEQLPATDTKEEE